MSSFEYSKFHCMLFCKFLKEKSQAEIMQLLASENDEWAEIFPLLSQLAAAGLVIPVSSVNCERDFSTMNRVKRMHTSKLFHKCSQNMKSFIFQHLFAFNFCMLF